MKKRLKSIPKLNPPGGVIRAGHFRSAQGDRGAGAPIGGCGTWGQLGLDIFVAADLEKVQSSPGNFRKQASAKSRKTPINSLYLDALAAFGPGAAAVPTVSWPAGPGGSESTSV